MRRWLWMAVLAGACGPDEAPEGAGLIGGSLADVYPSRLFLDAEGHVDSGGLVDRMALPRASAGDGWRTGWSPGQVVVVRLPGVDPADLPDGRTDTAGQGSVRLLDLTDGVWWPTFAEIDAWPDLEDPALLVRPAVALPPGHDIAVVVTTDAADRPARFDALVAGAPPDDLAALAAPTERIVDVADGLGLPAERIALAVDFPVQAGDGALDAALALRDPADVGWALGEPREGEATEGAWRTVEGTLTTTGVLAEDGTLATDADGAVVASGIFEADVWVHVPESVLDAPARSVPVVLFGHGIFGKPGFYLGEGSDVTRLMEDCGCIAVATSWRGLSRDDLGLATGAGMDFTTLPRIPAHLVQAQVALRTLAEVLRDGELLDAPALQGRDGQRLASDDLDYYGISLGGIQGAVFLEAGAPVDEAVLHVPGAMWSTMLERSSNYAVLEALLLESTPDPHARQRLYAWSQVHWDPADPIADAPALARTRVLLQEALADEQVPNRTTRTLARSAGLPAVGPVPEAPWGLPAVAAPHDGPGYVQAATGEDPPADVNRPADVTGAHNAPRRYPGIAAQTLHFLQTGEVEHFCGDAPCGPDNPGE